MKATWQVCQYAHHFLFAASLLLQFTAEEMTIMIVMQLLHDATDFVCSSVLRRDVSLDVKIITWGRACFLKEGKVCTSLT